jgi:hypothetical protein
MVLIHQTPDCLIDERRRTTQNATANVKCRTTSRAFSSRDGRVSNLGAKWLAARFMRALNSAQTGANPSRTHSPRHAFRGKSGVSFAEARGENRAFH